MSEREHKGLRVGTPPDEIDIIETVRKTLCDESGDCEEVSCKNCLYSTRNIDILSEALASNAINIKII